MTVFSEFEFLFDINAEGIKQVSSVDGMNNRIKDWLYTPEGTVADNPSWGSPLRGVQFEPHSPYLEIEIQMAIVQKIRRDVRDLTVRAVSVSFPNIDMAHIIIYHDLGVFEDDISLDSGSATNGVI